MLTGPSVKSLKILAQAFHYKQILASDSVQTCKPRLKIAHPGQMIEQEREAHALREQIDSLHVSSA